MSDYDPYHDDPVSPVEITDLFTGKVHRIDSAPFNGFSRGWWEVGNGNCDCNRGLACGIENVHCGTERFIIQLPDVPS